MLILPCIALAWWPQDAHEPPRKVNRVPLPAPTFYLVLREGQCRSYGIDVRGATNLPAGAIIDLGLADFHDDGWTDYSDEVNAIVGEDGHFAATIPPKPNLTLPHNVIITATFGTVYHHQPQNVLKVVGNHGENLDDLGNPQAETVSGFNTILETIARGRSCGP
jgi:hypothetical protein